MSDAPKTPTPTPLPRAAKPSLTPINGNSGKWETWQLAIKLSCVTVLVVAIVAFFCLSGKSITIEQVGLLILAGASLAGITVANHRKGGGPTGTTTLLGGALLMLTTVLAGCGAGAIVPDPNPNDGVEPCSVERALVEGLDDAVGAVDEVLPDDAPKADEGLAYARGGVEQGLAAVAACEALTSEGRSGLSAVLPWLQVAGHVVRGLLAILGAAGVDIPDALEDVLHSLGLARAVPIEREAPYVPEYIDVAVAL